MAKQKIFVSWISAHKFWHNVDFEHEVKIYSGALPVLLNIIKKYMNVIKCFLCKVVFVHVVIVLSATPLLKLCTSCSYSF